MELQVLSPAKVLYKDKINKVSLANQNGCFQIRKNHARLVSTLFAGDITFIESATKIEKKITIKGGVVEVFNNVVRILIT